VIDLGGWDHPELNTNNMIEAELAWFVIESKKSGSMGAPETIPFSSMEAAAAFTEQFGGRVLKLADIPDSYILGPAQATREVHAGHQM
jgi:copper chaperone NosL